MPKMKKVALRKALGEAVAEIEIPDEAVGPDIIERGGLVYLRKTQDVYHEATRLIVGNA